MAVNFLRTKLNLVSIQNNAVSGGGVNLLNVQSTTAGTIRRIVTARRTVALVLEKAWCQTIIWS